MRKWIMRWIAYLLLPAGVVLLFLPLSTYRAEYVEQSCLFLGVTETLDGTVAASGGYPLLQPDSLASYPTLQAAILEITVDLDRFRQSRTNSLPRQGVAPEEWERFQPLHAPNGTFQYENRVFEGRLSPTSVLTRNEVPHLQDLRRIAGVIFLLGGMLALFRSYPAGTDGICIGRRSAVIIWDAVIIGIGVFFALWFLDMVFAQVFNTSPEWKEDITWGMGAFMVLLANPGLALITTFMSVQTLWITRDKITMKGLFGTSSIAWADLEGFRVSEAYSPRKVGGFFAPHRLMKILEVDGGGSTMRIMEPPYASTRKEITAAFIENAPEAWMKRIETVSKEWMSKW